MNGFFNLPSDSLLDDSEWRKFLVHLGDIFSYVLTGTETGMAQTFGSTCHGAGRARSRNDSRRNLDYKDVLANLEKKGISIRVASPKLVSARAFFMGSINKVYVSFCNLKSHPSDISISTSQPQMA